MKNVHFFSFYLVASVSALVCVHYRGHSIDDGAKGANKIIAFKKLFISY